MAASRERVCVCVILLTRLGLHESSWLHPERVCVCVILFTRLGLHESSWLCPGLPVAAAGSRGRGLSSRGSQA